MADNLRGGVPIGADRDTTSPNPHVARLVLSAFIGIAPEHKLRVVAPDVGGGFGPKVFIYPEETVCLWAETTTHRWA